MSRNALQIFQAEDPAGYELLKLAAELSRSEKVPVAQRMSLLIEISETVAPYLVKAAAEAFEKPKYEYKWVNGARIKTQV